MFSFLTSLYDDPDRCRSAVSALGNLHQRNKLFSSFMPEFTRLMNDVGYTDGQAKIDLLLVRLSDKMNQLLIGQDMSADYLGYVTRFYKLDTDVCIASQRKNLRTTSWSNPAVLGNLTNPNYTASNPKPQSSIASAFSYQPPTTSQTEALSSPFSVPPAVQSLPTLMKLDSSSRPRGLLTKAEKTIPKTARFMQLLRHSCPWDRLCQTRSTRRHSSSMIPRQKSQNVDSPLRRKN